MIRRPFNLQAWINENRDLLKPPVGNKNLFHTLWTKSRFDRLRNRQRSATSTALPLVMDRVPSR